MALLHLNRRATSDDDIEAEVEMRAVQRKLRRYGRKGFMVVKSAEGSPISKKHLDLLQPADS